MAFSSSKQRKYVMSQMSKNKSSKLNFKHRKITGEQKFNIIMSEYKSGELHNSNGGIVTDKKQALAIAYSEARKIQPNYGKSSLTPIETKDIHKSISEEKKAQRDYTQRSKESRSKRVKTTFNHIKKEEHTHEKELKHLL
jgi:hypothetical protein